MTGLGQAGTSANVCDMTASPSEADMMALPRDVAEVPGADIMRMNQLWRVDSKGDAVRD